MSTFAAAKKKYFFMREILYVQSSYILMVLFALFLSGLAWLVAFVVNVTMHDRKE